MVDQDDMNRRVLLSLFCGRKVERDILLRLTEEDWVSIKKMAVTHRLLPMVYWIQKDNPDIPKEFIELAYSSYKKNAMRSLILQRELLFIHDLFSKAGIKFIPLKGGYLAWFAYPQPALRVNRDIDILVPKESIEAAYNLLIENGFVKYMANLVEDMAQDEMHLPPLVSPLTKILIELHYYIFPQNDDINYENGMEVMGSYGRVIEKEINNKKFSFLSPEDNLLHVILHTVYQHHLNNGPIILHDVVFLVKTHSINWQLFWSMAQKGKWELGCLLILSMVSHYFPDIKIEIPEGIASRRASQEILGEVEMLFLTPPKGIEYTRFYKQLVTSQGGFEIFKNIVGIIFPKRKYLAKWFNDDITSSPIVWILLRYWYDLLVNRFPQYLLVNFGKEKRKDYVRMRCLVDNK